jgi:Ca2+-binding EF-hand superfamily protein
MSGQVVRPASGYIQASGTSFRTGATYAAQPTQGVTYRTVGASGVTTSAAPTYIQSTGTPVTVQKAGSYSLGQYAKTAYETKHQEDPQLKNLKDLRSSCGLKYVPVADGLKALKSAAVDNKLTRDVFIGAYASLLKNNGIEVPAESVKNAVFDLFDRDDNGVVDMMELICGISLLCQGSEEDKIHAVFEIFDENGDGFISMDEMFKFLTSVFKVVLTPNVMGVMRSMGVEVESAEDLASVTALECFKAADLNQDGKLSITEFKEWFYAPKNDPSFLFSPMRKMLQ